MLGKLKDNRGFTIIEFFIVFMIIGILAQIAFVFVRDLKTRTSDVVAIADGKNLMTIVTDNFVNLEDVDYTQINGADVGVKTVGGVARPPVFTLSSGVRIRVEAGSQSDGTPETGYFEAYLYNIDGTSDAINPSGKREFYYLADEAFSTYTLATF